MSSAERYIAMAEFHRFLEKASSPSRNRAFTGFGVWGGAVDTARSGQTSFTFQAGSIFPVWFRGEFPSCLVLKAKKQTGKPHAPQTAAQFHTILLEVGIGAVQASVKDEYSAGQ